jgi:hypothetical protein
LEKIAVKSRLKNAAQNFSLISKIALNMIRNLPHDFSRGSKVISAKRKRKMAAWNNEYLLKILLSFDPNEIKTA